MPAQHREQQPVASALSPTAPVHELIAPLFAHSLALQSSSLAPKVA